MLQLLTMLVVSTLFATSTSAQTRTCAGVAFPERITVDGVPLRLNGLGLREATIFSVDVYVAALYAEHPSRDAKSLLTRNERKRTVFHFLRDTSKAEIVDELDELLHDNAPKADPKLKQTFFKWLEGSKKGERMVFTYVPGRGLSVVIHGVTKGRIKDVAFAQAVLSTLIGPEPPNDGLRTGLLGGRCD